MSNKLPPLPETAFEHGEQERHELPQGGCDHYYTYKDLDVTCTKCGAGWIGLAKHLTLKDGHVV